MIRRFEEYSGTHPRRIIIFRDGVGDSQFPEILQKEMTSIRRACKQAGGDDYTPPITFLAVQKRHKVRFFTRTTDGQIGAENVPSGTVVDKQIVGGSDFYLVSHKGMLGTSRPTHYHVLWDDSDFKMGEIQMLDYFLAILNHHY
jgi:eukaryotic translation initiation factor 2C